METYSELIDSEEKKKEFKIENAKRKSSKNLMAMLRQISSVGRDRVYSALSKHPRIPPNVLDVLTKATSAQKEGIISQQYFTNIAYIYSHNS